MKPTNIPTDNKERDRLFDPQTLKLDNLGLSKLEVAEVAEPYDRLQEIYKDYSLYFMIANGEILGVSIVNPDKSKAWVFDAGFWIPFLSSNDRWYLQIARRFVDEVLTK